jgi:hypothetical protein
MEASDQIHVSAVFISGVRRPLYQFHRRLSRLRNRYGRAEEEKNSHLCW